MKFCSHCGKEIMDEAVVCPGCGCAVDNKRTIGKHNESSIGWGILGFFIPIVGLIIYLVNRKKNPAMAKTAGIGALIGFGIWTIWLGIRFYISVLEEAKFAAEYPNIWILYH